MARYIDADLIKNIELIPYKRKSGNINVIIANMAIAGAKQVVDKIPTADVAPVVHSHWKEYEDYSGAVYPECARCGLVWWLDEGTAEDNEMYYCPNCGAKMDEVHDG